MSKDLWKEKQFCLAANKKSTFPKISVLLKGKKIKINIETVFVISSWYESWKTFQEHPHVSAKTYGSRVQSSAWKDRVASKYYHLQ